MISKKKFITGIIISVLISAIVFSSVTFYVSRRADVVSFLSEWLGSDNSDTAKFDSVFYDIVHNHLYELDKDKLIEDAIDGMLSNIDDKYTFYLTKEENEASKARKDPSYVGIGITVNTALLDDAVLITAIDPKSNAIAAGLLEGDEIVEVDGLRCTNDNKNEMIAKARGEEGTFASIIVRRNGEELSFSVERKMIKVSLVLSTVFDGDTGYIRLTSFQVSAVDDFNTKLDELLDGGIKSLIVDLRGNGGGYKDVVLKLVDRFVPEGIITSTVNNRGVIKVDRSSGNMIDIPFVVLVDGNTASASELFAGAVQDHKSGILIGTKTFGKGIVQYTHQLEDGSYYQFTAEEWLTPNGNNIQKVGLTPDIIVDPGEEFEAMFASHTTSIISPEDDIQLAEAIRQLDLQ